MADASPTAGPDAQVRALFEQTESRHAQGRSRNWSPSRASACCSARSAENVAALTRIGADFGDLVLRNLRLAGRADVTRLARQLHRTEDKLERLLQEVEELRDEFARVGIGERALPVKAGATAHPEIRPRELKTVVSTTRDTGSGSTRGIRVRERDPDDPGRQIGQTLAKSSGRIAERRSTATARAAASTRSRSCSCSR